MVEPLCPYFGQCGGCNLQHIAYEDQLLRQKKEISDTLGVKDLLVFHAESYYYRNRMDFIFSHQGLGLRKQGQWDVIVPVEQCVIADKSINIVLREVQQYFSRVDVFDIKKRKGTFRYALIRKTSYDL